MASNIHFLAHGCIKQLESLCSALHERDIKASARVLSGVGAMGKFLQVVTLTQGLVTKLSCLPLCSLAKLVYSIQLGIAFNFQVCHTLLM